ncbi:MAG: hypothetical protein SGILL_006981, partial [Bacillariaceae sp.]
TIAVASAAAAAAIGIVQGSSNNNNNNNNNFPSDVSHSSSPYLYSEIHSVDLSSDDENDIYYSELLSNNEKQNILDDAVPSSDDDGSVVASSSLYDGGCYVSTQAIMCQGGGPIHDTASSPLPSSMDATPESLLQHLLDHDILTDLLEEEDENSDDNEDDDDDDGHSSMLSNACVKRSKRIRKSKCYAGGASSGSTVAASSQARQTSFAAGKVSSASFGLSKALNVRGGAAATAVGSELSKKLINAAIVTLLFEACCGHILEFFKIVMQTSPPGTTYGSVFKDITNEKGMSGLWDGFVPWGVVQAVLKGGVFGLAYDISVKALKPLADEGRIPMKLAMTLAGGIAGGFQGFVLSPTLLMKTRVMTNEVFRESMSLLQTTRKSITIGGDIIKKEGLGSLMKGANTFATKRVFDWSSRYFFADLFESLFVHMKGGSLTVSEKITSSLLGGVASTVLTLPLDVLVAKTQDAKKAGVKVSAWRLFSDELQTEGWVGLKDNYLRGFEARLLHVCLTTVVMKTIAPIVYNIIFGPGSQ